MKKIFSTLFVVFFATSMMAQLGLTCETAIPVDSNYVGRVEGPCELWYTAWSYDLPLNVHFIPDADGSTWGPEVVVDFTCVPGVYDDPKLDSLLTMAENLEVSFPVTLGCNLVTPNGKNEWNLSINQNYREILAEYGITYNVQAFVKVVFEEAGTVSLRPDTAFQACMDNTPKINLGDTIEILPNDTEAAYVFSYTEWQEDSIRFVWIGDEPARVYLATIDCEFVPEENNGFVWNVIDVAEGAPYKLYSEQIKQNIKDNKAGGIYYGKVVAPSAGKFVVEKIPMSEAQGGAIMLEYGKTIQLAANDTNTLYCFPRTWKATRFTSSTNYLLQMYASPSYDFEITSASIWRRIFIFDKDEDGDGRVLNISSKEMQVVTNRAKDDYIYVRFKCNAPISVTPELWEPSECADQSTLIRPNASFAVLERSSNTIYRMRYVDWVGYDLTIQWVGHVKLPTYIADACSYTLSATNSHVLKYVDIPAQGTVLIDAATIDSWASRVDEEGYLYVRFNPSNQGSVTFISPKPAETDPEGPVTPDPEYVYESAAICFGETYEWNGQTLTESGKYTHTATAENGAVTITELTLTVYPQTPATTEEVTVEFGATYEWNGVTYVESGIYTITLQDENGCDYQATLVLTVLPETLYTTESAAICFGEAYDWNGVTYTESGEYTYTTVAANGADSIVTLQLTVYPQTPATTEEVTVEFGATYEWNGVVYKESGVYTITLQDENGCDYQATLVLTVLPEPVSPCVAASTLLEPVAELTINLQNAVAIYRIDYQAWVASGVNLVWSGAAPLHTFVAKDCEFAVAIYHRDVVNYTEVPAEGNVVLSQSILSGLEQYVDADGYLYVRFLTEFEGQLTTELAE